MSLIIDKSRPIGSLFVRWVIKKLRNLVIMNINVGKVSRMQRYINDNFPDIHINLLGALWYSLRFLKFKDFGRYYKIYLDLHNKVYMGESLEDIIKFIDNGNLEIDGCGVFTRAFLQIETELPELLEEYECRGGRV